MARKKFSKERGISKLIFSFLMLAVFASIFGPSAYNQFNQKIDFAYATDSGYGGGGGDGIFPCSRSNLTVEQVATFTNLIDDQTISVGEALSFNIEAINLTDPTYTLFDSFLATSITNANINSSGNFTWTPIETDIGIHNIEVVISDSCGEVISTTFKIVVNPLVYLLKDPLVEPLANSLKPPNIFGNKFVPKLPNAGIAPSLEK